MVVDQSFNERGDDAVFGDAGDDVRVDSHRLGTVGPDKNSLGGGCISRAFPLAATGEQKQGAENRYNCESGAGWLCLIGSHGKFVRSVV